MSMDVLYDSTAIVSNLGLQEKRYLMYVVHVALSTINLKIHFVLQKANSQSVGQPASFSPDTFSVAKNSITATVQHACHFDTAGMYLLYLESKTHDKRSCARRVLRLCGVLVSYRYSGSFAACVACGTAANH